MIRIDSVLTHQAEARTTLSGEAAVIFRIAAGGGWPFEVRWTFGSKPEDFLEASKRAALCKRGAWIAVEAEIATPRTDHSTLAILLHGVKRIEVTDPLGGFLVPGLLR